MSIRIEYHPCYVLHTKPYRDTSLLVDLLTHEHGRISAVARSARGPRSRFRGLLRPFTPLLISWYGKTELMTLTSVETSGMLHDLVGESLLSGLYLNELLMRLLVRYDSHPQLFWHYSQTLAQLQLSSEILAINIALRQFELRLLIELGYGFSLHQEAIVNQPIENKLWYRFEPSHGLMRVHAHDPGQNLFKGEHLLALHANNLTDSQVLQAAKRLMRLAFAALLGGKPLKTRELFG